IHSSSLLSLSLPLLLSLSSTLSAPPSPVRLTLSLSSSLSLSSCFFLLFPFSPVFFPSFLFFPFLYYSFFFSLTISLYLLRLFSFFFFPFSFYSLFFSFFFSFIAFSPSPLFSPPTPLPPLFSLSLFLFFSISFLSLSPLSSLFFPLISLSFSPSSAGTVFPLSSLFLSHPSPPSPLSFFSPLISPLSSGLLTSLPLSLSSLFFLPSIFPLFFFFLLFFFLFFLSHSSFFLIRSFFSSDSHSLLCSSSPLLSSLSLSPSLPLLLFLSLSPPLFFFSSPPPLILSLSLSVWSSLSSPFSPSSLSPPPISPSRHLPHLPLLLPPSSLPNISSRPPHSFHHSLSMSPTLHGRAYLSSTSNPISFPPYVSLLLLRFTTSSALLLVATLSVPTTPPITPQVAIPIRSSRFHPAYFTQFSPLTSHRDIRYALPHARPLPSSSFTSTLCLLTLHHLPAYPHPLHSLAPGPALLLSLTPRLPLLSLSLSLSLLSLPLSLSLSLSLSSLFPLLSLFTLSFLSFIYFISLSLSLPVPSSPLRSLL
ncbi:hypothetical protein C7M84_003102, partial [Penaeus vannamei]